MTRDATCLERCLEEWRTTGRALGDPATRVVLFAPSLDEADFAEAGPPS